MARFPRTFKELCTPAAVYFVLSMIGLLLVVFQNISGSPDMFYMGNFSCKAFSPWVILFFEFVYILFWTYLLNLICKDGHHMLSWFIVLLPFILLFIIMALFMAS